MKQYFILFGLFLFIVIGCKKENNELPDNELPENGLPEILQSYEGIYPVSVDRYCWPFTECDTSYQSSLEMTYYDNDEGEMFMIIKEESSSLNSHVTLSQSDEEANTFYFHSGPSGDDCCSLRIRNDTISATYDFGGNGGGVVWRFKGQRD